MTTDPKWFEETPMWAVPETDVTYTYGGVPEQKLVEEPDVNTIECDYARVDVKTSPELEIWESGAVRDDQGEKPRYDLIDPEFLFRMAEVMRKGAEHYGEFNWTKGIPTQRYMASLLRHVFAYYAGDNSEDHLAAAAFNLMGIMRNEGTELDDLYQW